MNNVPNLILRYNSVDKAFSKKNPLSERKGKNLHMSLDKRKLSSNTIIKSLNKNQFPNIPKRGESPIKKIQENLSLKSKLRPPSELNCFIPQKYKNLDMEELIRVILSENDRLHKENKTLTRRVDWLTQQLTEETDMTKAKLNKENSEIDDYKNILREVNNWYSSISNTIERMLVCTTKSLMRKNFLTALNQTLK